MLETVVGTIDHLRSHLSDNTELYEMSKAEGAIDDLAAIETDAHRLRHSVEQLEFRRMFSNPADPGNCFVDIQAGAGGTEACDWAAMLLRQYLKYCEKKGFTAELLEETEGDVAGIRSATLKIEGDYAFGHLRTETGVHRLVRKSPFDSAGGRHTSFASLFVYPEVDDSIEIEINPADVRLGGAADAHSDRDRRPVPERPQPTPQPRRGLADVALAPVRTRDAQAAGGAAEARGHQDRRRLGTPDPQLRARPEPHQGPAHRGRDQQHAEGARRRPRPVHRSQPEAGSVSRTRPGAVPSAQPDPTNPRDNSHA
jgi:hypothetical protein